MWDVSTILRDIEIPNVYFGLCSFSFLYVLLPFIQPAPRVQQLEGNTCEITWETISPMRGDPVSYVLQVLVGRESEYKQVCLTQKFKSRANFFFFIFGHKVPPGETAAAAAEGTKGHQQEYIYDIKIILVLSHVDRSNWPRCGWKCELWTERIRSSSRTGPD